MLATAVVLAVLQYVYAMSECAAAQRICCEWSAQKKYTRISSRAGVPRQHQHQYQTTTMRMKHFLCGANGRSPATLRGCVLLVHRVSGLMYRVRRRRISRAWQLLEPIYSSLYWTCSIKIPAGARPRR